MNPTKFKDDHLAKEAERLLHDIVLQKAMEDCRTDKLELLAKANPEDFVSVMRLQSEIAALDQVNIQLHRYVTAVDSYEGTPI